MRALASVLIVVVCAGIAAAGDALPLLDYRTGSWFLPHSPGVTGGPAAGLFNPAAPALSDRAAFDFWLNDSDREFDLDEFGLAWGRHLNLALNRSFVHDGPDRRRVDDWQVGLAGGDRRHTFGLAYRWSGGDDGGPLRDRALVAGAVARPARFLSLGAARAASLQRGSAQNVFDLGLRPLGDARLTLFADWTVDDGRRFLGDGVWGAGCEWRPLRGVHLGVRVRENGPGGDADYALMVGLSDDGHHSTVGSRFDADGERRHDLALVRVTPAHATDGALSGWFDRKPRYFALNLENKHLTYQKYRFLDDKRIAWLDLLRVLNAVRDEDDIRIVAVNLSGFTARPSLLWELRTKLLEMRRAGKEVVVQADNLGLAGCYLASAGDRVVLDPRGLVRVPGIALTRSYLKGTFEKLGLGFQEHRYYRYKSAAETLSRDGMSDADREQRQRVADLVYETLRDGIAEGRNRATGAIDAVVDDLGILTAGEALDVGLVDALGRWDDELKRLAEERDARPARLPEAAARTYWDERWGAPPRIPVVFTVGACAMDSGVKGRATSAYLRRLAADPRVAAVVLRVDSPGGSPLPSDLIADGVRKLRAAGKPVVVSQGDVAASGGYWISMDGSRILTTPLTLTGSIGVISGWVWDDGLAAKAGVSADAVQRGRHADLFSNVVLPFLGSLPRRPMNEQELARTETVVRSMYDDFIAGVARGRGLPPARVDSLAQGRVWMGGDAVAHDLCDGLGGLDAAVAEARRLAGLAPGDEIRLTEYPPRPWVRWPSFAPRLPDLMGLGGAVERLVASALGRAPEAAPGTPGVWEGLYLGAWLERPGEPQLLMAPDLAPEAWRRLD